VGSVIELFIAPIVGSDNYYLVIARGDEILLTHRGNASEEAAREYGKAWVAGHEVSNQDYAQLRAYGRKA
jgi:hypothetical protein